MNKLKTEKKKAIIADLMEGMSVRATSRITGACKQAILKLQADLGCACAAYHNDNVRGLKVNGTRFPATVAIHDAKRQD